VVSASLRWTGDVEKCGAFETGVLHDAHVCHAVEFMKQSGLENMKLDNPISCDSEVEHRVHFNCYACGIHLSIRTLDYPKPTWWFILVWIHESRLYLIHDLETMFMDGGEEAATHPEQDDTSVSTAATSRCACEASKCSSSGSALRACSTEVVAATPAASALGIFRTRSF
jgi:hypothetical protein